MLYTQSPPPYAAGSDGLTGNLEPYNRPGKTSRFRSYTYFLQPKKDNSDVFWNQVVDPVWLANSPAADANAMRSAQGNTSIPWRLLHRVTYSERYLPPISTATTVVPHITPLVAIPVTNAASDFIHGATATNDIEAQVVLAAPTASGAAGPANNVIQLDVSSIPSLINSILGLNKVVMARTAPPGSRQVRDVADPADGTRLYSIYNDPNGAIINVGIAANITVYQDVNSNPIQYFDGKTYHSIQTNYTAGQDGSAMFYIEPPADYEKARLDPQYDPGSEDWRYYLVSGFGADLPSVTKPFGTVGYNGFTVAGPSSTPATVPVKGVAPPNVVANVQRYSRVRDCQSSSRMAQSQFKIRNFRGCVSLQRSQSSRHIPDRRPEYAEMSP
jgi:hypothetical protein